MASRVDATSLLHCTLPKYDKILSNLLIWVDENIDENNSKCQKVISRLKHIVQKVDLCTTCSKCLDILRRIDDVRVFIVVSGHLGSQLVPEVHETSCVDTIYVFCNNKTRYEQLSNKWNKVRGIFTSTKSIYVALYNIIKQYECNVKNMIYIPKQTNDANEWNLSDLPINYMYSLLIKEILLEINDSSMDKSLDDVVNYGHSPYRPISWYTLINNSLITLDIESTIKLESSIRHLHRDLQHLHEEQRLKYEKEIIVYRGQIVEEKELKSMFDTLGGLLSFTTFLSTTTEREDALKFIENCLDKDKSKTRKGIFFIMAVDSKNVYSSSTPFALVSNQSVKKADREILFSMHTTFQVNDVKQAEYDERIWEVKLVLVAESNNPQLIAITKRMREQFDGKGWYRMGKFLTHLGHFDQAKELYTKLLGKCIDDSERALAYHQLGFLTNAQGKYNEAITFYNRVLEIDQKTVLAFDISLSTTYSNIAQAYSNICNDTKALEYYEKAHKILEESLPSDHLDLAVSYNNVGRIYHNMGDYAKALDYCKKSHEILEKTLHSNHSRLATSYDNMSVVYEDKNDFSEAFHCYEKAHRIYKHTLPSDHPDLAASYARMGELSKNMGNYTRAVKYYEKTLGICKVAQPPNPSDIALCYNRIGIAYSNAGEHLKAIEYHEKACRIYKKCLPSYHPYSATSYSNIAVAYSKLGNSSKALEHLRQAQEIFEKSLSPNHLDLATCYSNTGGVYYDMGDDSKALEYCEKAHQIYEEVLPPNHPVLAASNESIRRLYEQKK